MIITDIWKHIKVAVHRIFYGPPTNYIFYGSGGFEEGKLIGEPEQIGAFSVILYGGTVTIGKNVKLGYGVKIISCSTILGSKDSNIVKPIEIGDYVEIGSNAVVLPGVKIGSNVTIGAGSVVTKDIPENSIAVGVPAKVIKSKPLKN